MTGISGRFSVGRGSGKTFAVASYVDNYARKNPGHHIAIIAPTLGDARDTCVEGATGILSFNRDVQFNRSWGELNGRMARQAVNSSARTRPRMPSVCAVRSITWYGSKNSHLLLLSMIRWTNMRLGLRLGARPHVVVSTTPKPRKVLKALLEDSNSVVTRATTADNPHLHESVRSELYKLYGGTRIGRQELSGELLEDIEGALWKRELIEDSRAVSVPELTRVVVSVDPSATAGGDACGIVVAGRAGDHAYVLEDLTLQASPE